jgi:hypothetical protein
MNKDQILLTVKIAAAVTVVAAATVALTSNKVKSAWAARRNDNSTLWAPTEETTPTTATDQ